MDPTDVLERQIADALTGVAAATHADDALLECLIRTAREGDAHRNAPRPRARWAKPLLAAAAVVVLAAGTVVLLNLPQTDVAPTGTSSTTSRSSSPSTSTTSPTAKVDAPFRPLSCTVPMPADWGSAQSPIIRPPGASGIDKTSGLSILGISARGDVLATSEATAHGEVVLVKPDRSTRVLYRVPATLGGQRTIHIGSGQLDDRWAVFDVVLGGGQGSIGAIEAVDLGTGSRLTVRPAGLGTELIVSAPQLLNGHVYWSEVTNTGQGHVYDYNLATHARSTLDSGSGLSPQVVGGAIEWSRGAKGPAGKVVWHGSPTLPVGFQVVSGVASTLLRDGSTFAWSGWRGTGTAQRQVIYLSTATMAEPEVVHASSAADGQATLLALSGPYVIFSNGSDILALDTRSGAATALVRSRAPATTAAAAGGIIALNVHGSKGGDQLVLVRADMLSELHC